MSGIVNSTGAVSGVIGKTSAPAVGTGTDGYVFTATGAGVEPAWEAAAAGGGITYASQWRLSSSLDTATSVITSNLEEVDSDGYGRVGSVFASPSTGVFSFPATGVWDINFQSSGTQISHRGFLNHTIQTTLNNSTWGNCGEALQGIATDGSNPFYAHFGHSFVFDVTNVSTHKCRFMVSVAYPNDSAIFIGHTTVNYTYFTFVRLGDT